METATKAAARTLSCRRLLIFDDDALVGKTIEFIAEDAGFSARFVSDQDAFLALVESWQPSHIVLDLIMPGVDVTDLIKRLGQLGCRARILIMSGAGQGMVDAAVGFTTQNGLDLAGVLPKPFSRRALFDMLVAEHERSG